MRPKLDCSAPAQCGRPELPPRKVAFPPDPAVARSWQQWPLRGKAANATDSETAAISGCPHPFKGYNPLGRRWCIDPDGVGQLRIRPGGIDTGALRLSYLTFDGSHVLGVDVCFDSCDLPCLLRQSAALPGTRPLQRRNSIDPPGNRPIIRLC